MGDHPHLPTTKTALRQRLSRLSTREHKQGEEGRGLGNPAHAKPVVEAETCSSPLSDGGSVGCTQEPVHDPTQINRLAIAVSLSRAMAELQTVPEGTFNGLILPCCKGRKLDSNLNNLVDELIHDTWSEIPDKSLWTLNNLAYAGAVRSQKGS